MRIRTIHSFYRENRGKLKARFLVMVPEQGQLNDSHQFQLHVRVVDVQAIFGMQSSFIIAELQEISSIKLYSLSLEAKIGDSFLLNPPLED